MKLKEAAYYIDGILSADLAVLSRAITLIESTLPAHQAIAAEILGAIEPHTVSSFRLGITGVPGVGKSTFIENFGKTLVQEGYKLAVLAVDPSSEISKGSILGDKTRMEGLSQLNNVFIRPSPNAGNLGGVARSTYETMLLCEAAGYNFIMVETVGVGQSEVAVARITDFFLLLLLAGAGDELQGIKRGIMEMADAVIITKADGDNLLKAKAARSEYAHALHLLQAKESGWQTQTHICSSTEQTGMAEIYNMLKTYRHFTETSGYFSQKRKHQQYELFLASIEEQLKSLFFSHPAIKKRIMDIKNESGIQPFRLAKALIQDFFKLNSLG